MRPASPAKTRTGSLPRPRQKSRPQAQRPRPRQNASGGPAQEPPTLRRSDTGPGQDAPQITERGPAPQNAQESPRTDAGQTRPRSQAKPERRRAAQLARLDHAQRPRTGSAARIDPRTGPSSAGTDAQRARAERQYLLLCAKMNKCKHIFLLIFPY